MSNDISSEANQTYRISELAQLSLVESIRRRPAMFIGSVDETGLLNTCKGFIESIYRECWNASEVHYSLAVADDHFQFACAQFETTFDDLANLFTNENANPFRIHGLCDNVTLNAVSREFRVCYKKGEQSWSGLFARGELQHNQVVPESLQQGLWLECTPDIEIFKQHRISVSQLRDWLQMTGRRIPNLSIDFHDLRLDTIEHIACPEGMAAQVTQMLDYHGLDRMAYPELIHFSDWTGDFRIDVAFTHHSFLTDHAIAAYCNGFHNSVGGAHVEGLVTGISDALNQFAEHERLVIHVNPQDVQPGLLAGISVFINQKEKIQSESPMREPNALLDSKIKATGQTITQSVHDFVHHKLFEYLRYEPGLGRAILAHVAA